MLDVERGVIVRMRCTTMPQSGKVLWSVISLLVSKETVVTHMRLGRGGDVRQGVPLRRDDEGYVVLVPSRGAVR